MFSSASWNDYFTYGIGLVLLYYFLSAPWLYRHEIKRRLKNNNASVLEHNPATIEKRMGPLQSRIEERIDEITDDESVVFTATVTPLDEHKPASDDSRSLNLISALMLEANTLASVIAGSAGTEDDINGMFPSMLEHYTELVHSPYFSSINVFLLNACVKEGLPVTATQVESWWPTSNPSA